MTTVDTIRTLTVKASGGDSVDALTDSLNKLSDATTNVAVVSDRTSQSTLNTSAGYDRIQRSLDPVYRSTQQLTTTQATLQRALDSGAISQDRFNGLMLLAQQRFDNATRSASPLTSAVGAIQTQMIALSAGAGPVGVFLASFGPWGLAAAAGVGLITAAIDGMITGADNLGTLAQTLRDVSEALNLSTDNLQKLQTAGANVGLTNDQVTSSFEKFNVQLAQLQNGQGTLYTALNRVNPALTQQLATAKDSATAWDLLAQAYTNASSQNQALITRAAFGRNGAIEGNLLTATAQAGGVQSLPQSAGALSPEQIASYATLKSQIDSTQASATNLYASLYAGDVLTAQKNAADANLTFAQSLKEIFDQQPGQSWLSALAIIGGGAGSVGYAPTLTPGAKNAPAAAPIPIEATGNPFDSGGQIGGQPNAQFDANRFKQNISALGDAATATQKLQGHVLELNSSLAAGTITQETYNQALAGAHLDAAVTAANAYVSALGPLASVQDQVNAKMLTVQRTQEQNGSFTADQIDQIRTMTEAAAEWTRANDQVATGNFDLATALTAAGDQLQTWIHQKLLDPNNPTQYAAALDVANAKIVAMRANAYDATPALKELHDAQFTQQTQFLSPGDLAAANAAKQIDPTNFAAHINDAGPQLSAFNTNLKQSVDLGADFANSFGQAMLQGKTATEAMNTALNTLASSLITMVSKNLVNNALGPLLNQLFPNSAVAGTAPAAVDILPAIHHSGGIIGEPGMGTRSVPLTAFFGAPRFHSGGVIGADEVPIIAKPGEGVFTPGQMAAMGGGGAKIENNITIENNSGQPVQTQSSKNSSGGQDTRIVVGSMMNERVASGSLDKTFAARYGLTPVGQRR